jgi:hypothetical protein
MLSILFDIRVWIISLGCKCSWEYANHSVWHMDMNSSISLQAQTRVSISHGLLWLYFMWFYVPKIFNVKWNMCVSNSKDYCSCFLLPWKHRMNNLLNFCCCCAALFILQDVAPTVNCNIWIAYCDHIPCISLFENTNCKVVCVCFNMRNYCSCSQWSKP